MNVLALVGSPRRDGNTAVLVQKVLEWIKSQNENVQITLLFLNDLKIRACQSCYSCLSGSGECTQDDDMKLIYKSLAQANIVILGSPIYMSYVSAQTKLFIDRLFPYAEKPTPPIQRDIKAVLVFTWGWDKADAYDYVIDEIKEILSHRDIKVVDVLKGVGFRYMKTDALERPDLLKKAFEIGVKLAKTAVKK